MKLKNLFSEENPGPFWPRRQILARVLLVTGLFFAVHLPCFGQTLPGSAAGDFYSAFSKMGIDDKKLTSLDDLKPYIPEHVISRLEENLVYRTAFICFAASQLGVITGNTSSAGFFETMNALTGFLMIVEGNGEIKEWTVKEISGKYEQLIASSWRNVNSPLFIVMLEAYCSYKRREIWR